MKEHWLNQTSSAKFRPKTQKVSGTVVFALTVALALTCAGCAGSNQGSSTSQTQEYYGKPWVTSVLAGNLPAEQPQAKDDLYTNMNYDYLRNHQTNPSSQIADHSTELQTAVEGIINDTSKTGHDLDQLRIFYNQALDKQQLQNTMNALRPYLDRIEAVSTLDEMNALLVADDFPFSPFILADIACNDTRTTNLVNINPNFVLSDSLLYGGTYYQDSKDPSTQQSLDAMLTYQASFSLIDLMNAGIATTDNSRELSEKLISFEKAHGKYLDSNEMYLKSDYGTYADAMRSSNFTLDELAAIAPNFPLKASLDKLGKGNSSSYLCTKAWLEAFNKQWTQENLDAIKLVAKAKLLRETRMLCDPSALNSVLESSGKAAITAEKLAYEASTNVNTLGNVVAKTYVTETLGPNAQPRLTQLSQNLIDSYKDLVNTTPWIGDDSRNRVMEKLNNMTLNILEPQGGYFDYSGLQLTPTEAGGTLFGNYLLLKQYRNDCEAKLVNQPATKAATWLSFTPTTVNAFYDASSNSINIFPGFITSLVYNDQMSDAELLATAGWTIGHEISHAFDYACSQFDAYGTPNPIYSDADVDKFVLKSSSLASYYKTIEIVPGQNVDGELVAGEATADLCGMQACMEIAAKTPNFDYDTYFKKLCNLWAKVGQPDMLQQQSVDVHPPDNLRINVSTQMIDALYDKLGIHEGDGMYLAPNQRIAIWGTNA